MMGLRFVNHVIIHVNNVLQIQLRVLIVMQILTGRALIYGQI